MDTRTDELLRTKWLQQLASVGCPTDRSEAAFADLCEHYQAPGRYYHTLEHVQVVLDTIRALSGGEAKPALLLAAWFHDVIYDTHANDNEERSAEHTRRVLQTLGVDESIVQETERLILLTKSHAPASGDRSGQILVDADLSVLAATELEYDAYARAIRQEYAWVPEAAYRAGRRGVLETFLQRPRIYATEEMFTRLEDAARRNLRREIEGLR
jgi:predicted metal-dependent HD superfamily phosphohydrolase